MASQALQTFLGMIKEDERLLEEVQQEMMNASQADNALAGVCRIAEGRGIELSVDELKENLPSIAVPVPPESRELTSDELEAVAGGMGVFQWAKACTGSTSIYCYICAMGTTG